MTRREYCERHGIPVTTFDYYRRLVREQPGRKPVRIVPVSLLSPKTTTTTAPESTRRFTLVLGNGRRIEGGWDVAEEDLARVVRTAERA